MKKTLSILIWISVILLITVAWFFTKKHYDEKPCTKVNIKINYNSDGRKSDVFLTYDDIRTFIRNRFDSLKGKPMGEINIEELELKTEEIPYVLDADAFKSINGEVSLNIKQRRAIVLVIDNKGNKYYIDEVGGIIPVRQGYPANVLVCNGNIPAFEFYGKHNNKAYKDSIIQNTILKDVYDLSKDIYDDEFYRKEITQLYLNPKNEFEMTPLVGRFRIIFGKNKNREDKFEKLKAFYLQARNHAAWGKYKTLNLKYKDQIVCTKK